MSEVAALQAPRRTQNFPKQHRRTEGIRRADQVADFARKRARISGGALREGRVSPETACSKGIAAMAEETV